jgi:serine protease AprX
MIHSYVLEIPEKDLDSLKDLKGIVRIEQDSFLTAQINTAKEAVRASRAECESKLGEEIGVAILDTGIYPHNDLVLRKNRILAFKDFVNGWRFPYDDNGHGTHVAGIIAGDGSESNGQHTGLAPACNIVGLKVLSKEGNGNVSDVLASIQWVMDNKEKYNIRVLNLSVGMEDLEGENAALVKGVDAAWDSGLVVVCAAGNKGPKKSSITTPGVSRKVITVGSSNDENPSNTQEGLLTNYSGRGPTRSCIIKPDVVAPGSNILSCNSDIDYKPSNMNYPVAQVGYMKKSGTSMATPIVTGILTRILSDYPFISNKELKLALKYSSINLGLPQNQQGWGLIDFEGLNHFLKQKI